MCDHTSEEIHETYRRQRDREQNMLEINMVFRSKKSMYGNYIVSTDDYRAIDRAAKEIHRSMTNQPDTSNHTMD